MYKGSYKWPALERRTAIWATTGVPHPVTGNAPARPTVSVVVKPASIAKADIGGGGGSPRALESVQLARHESVRRYRWTRLGAETRGPATAVPRVISDGSFDQAGMIPEVEPLPHSGVGSGARSGLSFLGAGALDWEGQPRVSHRVTCLACLQTVHADETELLDKDDRCAHCAAGIVASGVDPLRRTTRPGVTPEEGVLMGSDPRTPRGTRSKRGGY